MNLNAITIGYSPASNDILMLGEGLDNCRSIYQEFWDVLEQATHGKPPIRFTTRGKNYEVEVRQV